MLDTDPLGPGLDRVLGMEDRPGVRWDELCQTTGRLGAASFRESVPRRDGLGVLTWYAGRRGTLQPFAVREVLSAARRGHETVVVDIPRSRGPLLDEVVARCDLVVVVARPTVLGLAAAARVVVGVRQNMGLEASGWTVMGPLLFFRFLYDVLASLESVRAKPIPGVMC